MKKHNHPVFAKAVVKLLFCLALSVFLYLRAIKNKTDFKLVKGTVEYLSSAAPYQSARNPNKFRYLKVTGYPKAFEIFIGKETGDFTPQFERMDSLKPGDTVAVYYDESLFHQQEEPVNRLAYFIDRKDKAIFIKGDWDKYFVYFFAVFCLVMLAVVWVLWRKGKVT